MKKKSISFLLVCCLLFNAVLVSANYMEKTMDEIGRLGVVQASDYNSFGGVTRYQALKSITLAMGLTNTLAEYADVIMYPEVNYINIDRPIDEFAYCDFEVTEHPEYYNNLFNENLSKSELEENYWHVKYNGKERGAVTVAFYNDITSGVIIDGKRYFLFEQEASLNEILTFMIRCLKGTDTDMSNIFETAVEIGLVDPEGHFDKTELQNTDTVGLGYFCLIMDRFINQKRYMYFDEDAELFPKASIDIDGDMTYKEYIMQNIAKNGMYSIESTGIIFTSEMAKEVADMVFKAKLGDYFVVQNSELTIDEFDGMYKITRKPPLPATFSGATIYINMYNGAVMNFLKE